MATFDTQTVGSDVSPSFTPNLRIQNNVITNKLGDNYEQRIVAGLNSTVRTWTLPFNNRDDVSTTNILNFLASSTGGNNGAKSFNWTPPYGATGKWVCENPTVEKVAYNINNIQLVFREVFEA